jgi:diguanylate cyclase (GGDEF)-like protein/PAS domain S-box-containing protein
MSTPAAAVLLALAWRPARSAVESLRSARRAASTLRSIGDAVVTISVDGRIESLNPVAEQLTGWKEAQACARPSSEILVLSDGATGEPLPDPAARCLREGVTLSLPEGTVLRTRDGRELWVEDSLAPVRDRRGGITGLVMVFRDVTAHRDAASALAREARQDALTGLRNRRELEEAVRGALAASAANGAPHSLLYLDLDGFKAVNDTCGHAAGDALLRQLAVVLAAQVRSGDILARLGGDEFGVLLEGCPIGKAREVALKLRRAVEEFRFVWQDRTFSVGVSIGAAPVEGSGDDLDMVLASADMACYAAKSAGGNRVHVRVSGPRAPAAGAPRVSAASLRTALAEDRFRLFWQPIAPLGRGGRQFEVLLRLADEDGLTIAPDLFIPVAERHRVMPDIDRWVTRRVLRGLAQGNLAAGGDVECYAINLSGTTIAQEGFLPFLRAELAATGIRPESLLFEVKESVAIADLAGTTRFMQRLHELGCRSALDDFGHGLSSFGYLKGMPVDFVKIDGRFVRNILEDPVDCVTIDAINRLGHVLGIRTIAELVESSCILGRLREMGVDYAQGYGIGHPVPLGAPSLAM